MKQNQNQKINTHTHTHRNKKRKETNVQTQEKQTKFTNNVKETNSISLLFWFVYANAVGKFPPVSFIPKPQHTAFLPAILHCLLYFACYYFNFVSNIQFIFFLSFLLSFSYAILFLFLFG